MTKKVVTPNSEMSWIERKVRLILFGKEDGTLKYAIDDGIIKGTQKAYKINSLGRGK